MQCDHGLTMEISNKTLEENLLSILGFGDAFKNVSFCSLEGDLVMGVKWMEEGCPHQFSIFLVVK